MSTLEEIKAAAARLDPDDQVELFKWWTTSATFKARQLAGLRKAIAAGIDQLDCGRFRTYHDSNLMKLAEEVGRAGRKRLKQGGRHAPA